MSSAAPLPPSAERVQAAIERAGLAAQVVELPQSAKTAKEAAQAIGCEVGQIVKSLLFRRADDGAPLLVLASGSNRVDESRVAAAVGSAIERPDAEFVRTVTGFAIGGVPPLGHQQTIDTVMDADLLRYSIVWASGGTPHAVFSVPPAKLKEATAARVVAVS